MVYGAWIRVVSGACGCWMLWSPIAWRNYRLVLLQNRSILPESSCRFLRLGLLNLTNLLQNASSVSFVTCKVEEEVVAFGELFQQKGKLLVTLSYQGQHHAPRPLTKTASW